MLKQFSQTKSLRRKVHQSALQNGSYVPGKQIQSTQNVPEYTVFPFADLQNYNDMNPTLGTCLMSSNATALPATLRDGVDSCTESNTLCCYTDTTDANQVSIVDYS